MRVTDAEIDTREGRLATALERTSLERLVDAITRVHAERTTEAALARLTREARQLVGAELALAAFRHDAAISLGDEPATDEARAAVAEHAMRLTGIVAKDDLVRASGAELGAGTPLQKLVETLAGSGVSLAAWLGVPIADASGARVGSLHVARASTFNAADESLLAALAFGASRAVENARLFGAADVAAAAREEVVAVVAHDLRNPLNNVALSASLLNDHLDDRGGDPVSQRFVRSITTGVARMNQLIESLLEVARIESGQLTLNRRPERAAAILTDALVACAPSAEAKGCHVERGAVDGDLELSADRVRVLQVLGSVLGSAISVTSSGGRIVASVARDGDLAVFTIADEVSGAAASALSKLFDRAGDAASGPRDSGALGRFIARGIVEAHGGTIGVASHAGAGIRVSLPLSLPR